MPAINRVTTYALCRIANEIANELPTTGQYRPIQERIAAQAVGLLFSILRDNEGQNDTAREVGSRFSRPPPSTTRPPLRNPRLIFQASDITIEVRHSPSTVLLGASLPLAIRANAVLRRCSASLPAIHVKTAAFNHSATSPNVILPVKQGSRRLLRSDEKPPKTADSYHSLSQSQWLGVPPNGVRPANEQLLTANRIGVRARRVARGAP